jgi:O-antigen ligase
LPAWRDTIKLSVKNPIGYGIATEKILFPVLCSDEVRKANSGQVWVPTHNDWLQILFETGFPGLILFLVWLISIIRKVKDPIKITGLIIIGMNMMFHFPLRIVQCPLIILAFLAYCERQNEFFD